MHYFLVKINPGRKCPFRHEMYNIQNILVICGCRDYASGEREITSMTDIPTNIFALSKVSRIILSKRNIRQSASCESSIQAV
jgi:hypothetical protein